MSAFVFKKEPKSAPVEKNKITKVWRILVVDDDDSVHQITKLVLGDAEIEHRRLDIVSVYSSVEAKALLSQDDSFCMAFVDVVMETEHAGLDLVAWIRNELKNQSIRLVLRTGQAGSAPEGRVIRDFDINDYKEKTDFTASKMMTTVYASIRAYRDLMTIKRSLDAFKHLIDATHELLKINQIRPFASAALNNLLTLMNVDSSALYIARLKPGQEQQDSGVIIACTGKYVSESESLASSTISAPVKHQIQQAFFNKTHFANENCFVGYYETTTDAASVLYIEFEDDSEQFKASLAQLYATNVALILESLTKRLDLEDSQKELMYLVGEAAETKSKEGGQHVKRVALICELLATKLGFSDKFIQDIRLAAPLHDIGKIGIPESILNKPGKLDDEEWKIMQTHAEIGYRLLTKSNANVAQFGAKIARFHHENWDGSGYPQGLTGLDIPVEARLMGMADVFDTLGSDRCYRHAWSNEKIVAYLLEQRGKKFEPLLVDLVIENIEEFQGIRGRCPD